MSVDQVLVVVGTGTDGASGNMGAHGGMKTKLHLGFSGHGALPTDWSWHAKMHLLAPPPSSRKLLKCFFDYIQKSLKNLPVLL